MLHGAGIFTYIYPKNGPYVGKYSIHGASGYEMHWMIEAYTTSVIGLQLNQLLLLYTFDLCPVKHRFDQEKWGLKQQHWCLNQPALAPTANLIFLSSQPPTRPVMALKGLTFFRGYQPPGFISTVVSPWEDDLIVPCLFDLLHVRIAHGHSLNAFRLSVKVLPRWPKTFRYYAPQWGVQHGDTMWYHVIPCDTMWYLEPQSNNCLHRRPRFWVTIIQTGCWLHFNR